MKNFQKLLRDMLFIFYLVAFGSTVMVFPQAALCDIDKSKMIPLRDATYRRYQYVIKLQGRAIKGETPYEIHFDTGSWTTSIPGGALDLSQITILEENIRDPWGNLADLVMGQLILESEDGTQYTIESYKFFATKDPNTGIYLPDDRTEVYGHGTNSIMGAFPSIDPYTRMASFPFAVAQKFAPEELGLGIISDCLDDITEDWDFFNSYLQIGIDEEISSRLNWRNDVPNWREQNEFHPEAIPGFKVRIDFPNTDQVIETDDNLIATLDTGAPDLTLRLGPTDPQLSSTFGSHFIKDGPWLNWNDDYRAVARSLINAQVTVDFTDSKGEENSYTFSVGTNPYRSPNSMYVGTWEGNVPWQEIVPDKPKNRINLGNTIYFYCPVYFWDIKNKRVGIAFKDKKTTSIKLPRNKEMTLFPNPASNQFNIRNSGKNTIRSIAMYDISGNEIVSEHNYQSSGEIISISCNYHGLVILHVKTDSGSWTDKILLQ